MSTPISPDEFKSLYPNASQSAIRTVARAWDEYWTGQSLTPKELQESIEGPIRPIAGAADAGTKSTTPEPESYPGVESVGSVSGTQSNTKKHLVIYRVRVRKLRDAENTYSKSATDALRYFRIVPDDDPKSLELKVIQIKVKTAAEEGTTIQIFPPGTW